MHAHPRPPDMAIVPPISKVFLSPVPRSFSDSFPPLGDTSERTTEGCAAEVRRRRFDWGGANVHNIVGLGLVEW